LRGHVDVDGFAPFQVADELFGEPVELFLDGAGRGGELQGEHDVAVVGDSKVFDESAVDDVLAEVGVDDVAEGV
jgi:hypothetical protein